MAGDVSPYNRPLIIAANWKMNKTIAEAVEFAAALQSEKDLPFERGEIVIAPPYTALLPVRQVLQGDRISLAGQNLHWEERGAFTGEVSAGMLLDAGCRYVLIGHSERRRLFGETDERVNKKIRTALQAGLRPIFCLGETLQERRAGETFNVVGRQVDAGLAGFTKEQAAGIVLAYEPVWAIGTGETATPAQAAEVHGFLRKRLEELYNAGTAGAIRIQYGGSVTPENTAELMAQPDIDGALVGGASLKVDSFREIIYRGFQAKGVLS
jgi:triosephosphate isomerase